MCYTINSRDQLTRTTDALGNITRYTYDELGNKLTQTDAQGRTTRWAYDALGRVSGRTLPLGQSESFTYDATDNRTAHTDFNAQTHTFDYDVMDRLVWATTPMGELSPVAIAMWASRPRAASLIPRAPARGPTPMTNRIVCHARPSPMALRWTMPTMKRVIRLNYSSPLPTGIHKRSVMATTH